MGISTHILDTALGRPASGVDVLLSKLVLSEDGEDALEDVGRGMTDADGRCSTLLGEHALERGTYCLRFETGNYFHSQNIKPLYPFIKIVFIVSDPTQHHHIPLLLTANGYTTYRGS